MQHTTKTAASSVDHLRANAQRQKEQLQQQDSVIIAREQRLHYLRQQQCQQSRSFHYSGSMRDNRLKELHALAFGHRLQRRCDSRE